MPNHNKNKAGDSTIILDIELEFKINGTKES
jgi:hypothetical protein